MTSVLRYRAPARSWTDALPLGNGRLGAMCFGGTGSDRIQINDETCWSGSPPTSAGRPLIRPGEGPEVVEKVREQLFAGDLAGAEQTIRRLQHGHTQAYQPLADLQIDHRGNTKPSAPVTGYERGLDLRRAMAWHSWHANGVTIAQEAWTSAPAGTLFLRRHAVVPDGHGPGVMLPNLALRMTSPHPTAAWRVSEPRDCQGGATIAGTVRMPSHVVPSHEDHPEPVRYEHAPGSAVTAALRLHLVTDGSVRAVGGRLLVFSAREIVVLLTTTSDYAGALEAPHGDVRQLEENLADRLDALTRRVTAEAGFEQLRREHEDDHAQLFERASLELHGEHDVDDVHDLPTDERLARRAAGTPDPDLVTLLFQYGRYLLIASSREGGMPANLQGIWNEKIRPPWSSNYTTNINVEMNYWPAEVANLSACHLPLLAWLRDLRHNGALVASELYGLEGWVAHHNSDAWAFALPAGEGDADPAWAAWPMGAAWLCRHLWDHWDYTRDEAFLAWSWPLVRDAGTFCMDWLVEGPEGGLVVAPSTSPENHYADSEGHAKAVSVSTTSDLVLVRDLLERGIDLLDACVSAEKGDEVWRRRALRVLERLPAERIAADGRLAEWSTDVADAEPGHRHNSHLVGLYPAATIDPDRAPRLAAAAGRTLDARGWDAPAWSLAWRIALRARLRDREGVAAGVDAILQPMPDDAPDTPCMTGPSGVYRNLFCAHPPFQIDGNFGFTAAVAEALLQSYHSTAAVTSLHVLPALPPAWPDGSFCGLRARGGVTVDAAWAGGRLNEVVVAADTDRDVDVRWQERRWSVSVPGGRAVTIKIAEDSV